MKFSQCDTTGKQDWFSPGSPLRQRERGWASAAGSGRSGPDHRPAPAPFGFGKRPKRCHEPLLDPSCSTRLGRHAGREMPGRVHVDRPGIRFEMVHEGQTGITIVDPGERKVQMLSPAERAGRLKVSRGASRPPSSITLRFRDNPQSVDKSVEKMLGFCVFSPGLCTENWQFPGLFYLRALTNRATVDLHARVLGSRRRSEKLAGFVRKMDVSRGFPGDCFRSRWKVRLPT